MSILKCRIVVSALLFGLATGGPVHAGTKTIELEIDGLVALADLVVPDNGSIEQGVLVITHGTQAHKDLEMIEALQNALAELGIASLAHTLTMGVDRRVGLYDCATPNRYLHEDALPEIAAWIAWLVAKDARPVSLLGHSRGGNQVAWFAAERAKGSIAKLVLIAPSINRTLEMAVENYQKRYNADLTAILKRADSYISAGSPLQEMNLPGFLFCKDAVAQARSIVSYYGGNPLHDTLTHLPKLEIPTLVIAGSADTIVRDIAKHVKPIVDDKKIKLEVIEDAGHFFRDLYIEDAADLIADFIEN